MDKVVVITGGTSDIGSEIIYYLASFGYDIVFTYLSNYDKAFRMKIDIESKYDVKANYFKCDVRLDEDIDRLYNSVSSMYSSVYVLINNACLCMDDYYKNVSRDNFISVLNTNMVGPFFMIQKFSDIMNIDGVIINIASTDGIDTYNPYSIDYSASKAGLINITLSLAMALDVRIVALAPNYVFTSSVLKMDKSFLDSEMKRIGQNTLISKKEIAIKVKNIIDDKSVISGSIERID